MTRSSWLFSRKTDLLFLFVPVWLVWVWAFSSNIQEQTVPLWAWVIFIVGIDVSHVWSTIFRTYLNKNDRTIHRAKLIWIPCLLLPFLTTFSYINIKIYWSILAYVAVYHFIKQQYGFMALYSFKNKEQNSPKKRLFDKTVIYIGMLYPIIFWHFDKSRLFNWFAEDDFLPLHQVVQDINIFSYLNIIYFAILLAWILNEVSISRKKDLALGKIIWVTTTYFNWFLGIVYFNSDFVFSVTNVVAHGIPYLVLILKYKVEEQHLLSNKKIPKPEVILHVFSIFSVILLLAFSEEYLWDMLINLEKQEFFESFSPYWANIQNSPFLIALFTAILTLPQATHYVLDGFIWKFGQTNPNLKKIIANE